MDALDADSPPLPQEPAASAAALNAGCILVCGLALLPMFYVGSFIALSLDGYYQGPLLRSLDEHAHEILVVIYWPLIWICEEYLF